MKRSLRLFAPALLYAVAVWIVGGLPSTPEVGVEISGLDKAAHFVMYAGLGFLLGFAWVRTSRGMTWVVPIVLAMLFGALDERRQAALPERAAELADWLADAAGVGVGFTAGVAAGRRRKPIEADERE